MKEVTHKVAKNAAMFLDDNFIYCQDTHSFVCRLFQKWKNHYPETYKEAQQSAFEVVGELAEEFKKHKKV